MHHRSRTNRRPRSVSVDAVEFDARLGRYRPPVWARVIPWLCIGAALAIFYAYWKLL